MAYNNSSWIRDAATQQGNTAQQMAAVETKGLAARPTPSAPTADEINLNRGGAPIRQQVALLQYREALDKELYNPHVLGMLDELKTMDYVNPATERYRQSLGANAAQSRRQKSRYAMNVNPAMRAYQARTQKFGDQLGLANTRSQARIDQYSKEQELRGAILGYGNSILGLTEQGASTGANAQIARKQAGDAMAAQQSQMYAGMVGSGVSMASMFAM